MRHFKLVLLAIVLTLLFSRTVRSGTRHPSAPDDKHLEYGKKFKCVAMIQGTDIESGEKKWASSVIIAPNWAITAAHVVDDWKNVEIAAHADKPAVPMHKVIMHQNYTADSVYGDSDVALCYTDNDFGLDFYPELYNTPDELGKVCSIAGFGHTGNFNTGFIVKDRKKRAGSNKISGASVHALLCDPTNRGRTELEFIICPGDSGGGLFIDNKLAGINSFIRCLPGVELKSDYNTEAGHTRISMYYDWIKLQMELHELAIQSKLTTGSAPEQAIKAPVKH